jgi:hypothetical protein
MGDMTIPKFASIYLKPNAPLVETQSMHFPDGSARIVSGGKMHLLEKASYLEYDCHQNLSPESTDELIG